MTVWFRHTWKYLHWIAAQCAITGRSNEYIEKVTDVSTKLNNACPICGKHFDKLLRVTKSWQPELQMYVIHQIANRRADSSEPPPFEAVLATFRSIGSVRSPGLMPNSKCQCKK